MESGVSEQSPKHGGSLAGCTIVITRPAGTGASLARHVRAQGGVPVLLPGLSLHAASDSAAARAQWQQAQHDDLMIFTSPAAVRYAIALAPFESRATVMAVGQSTARALQSHGIAALSPDLRQDSEGVLAMPALQALQGRRIALITAPDGRGVLQEQLAARGATLRNVHVYRRGAPRLNRRHIEVALQLPAATFVLISSAEAMRHLLTLLPAEARNRLRRATAIVSSERIAGLARLDGFVHVHVAASAHSADLLARAGEVCSHLPHEAGRAGC